MVISRIGLLVLLGAVAFAPAARSEAILNDWLINVNGNITANSGVNNPVLPGNINGAAFDFSLNPLSNTLGTLTITLGAGNNQFVDIYLDYDLNFAASGSFNDFAGTSGASTGFSYELDDPNTSNIYTDTQTNALTNTNNVAAGKLFDPNDPTTPCCDVAWSLGLSNLDGPGILQFVVSKSAPASGFYLRQQNQISGEQIFLSGVFPASPNPNSDTPEPAECCLLALGCAVLFIARKSFSPTVR